MGENEIDELGPVDYLVVEFPAGKSSALGMTTRTRAEHHRLRFIATLGAGASGA